MLFSFPVMVAMDGDVVLFRMYAILYGICTMSSIHKLKAVSPLGNAFGLYYNIGHIMLNSLPRIFSGISEVVVVVGTKRLFAMSHFTTDELLFATTSETQSNEDSNVLPYPNVWLIAKSMTEKSGAGA